MNFNRSVRLLLIVILVCLTGCVSTETTAHVVVKPNNSGIEVGGVRSEEPSWLIGRRWDVNGKLDPPDIPTRTVVEVKLVRSLNNKEPRYFIPASGAVQIASIERWSKYGRLSTLKRWHHLIHSPDPLGDTEQKMLNDTQLPEIPGANAGRCFHAKIRKKSFPWGDAVLFLTSYVQGRTGGPVNNDMLVLVAQGFTKDGRYAVNARFEIHHPALPNSSWDKRRKGRAVFSIDDECEEAERWLDAQPDDSFAPTFDQYQQFLSSLEITQGK